MNISAKTLFHYTPTIESLLSILEKGFEFRLIQESIPCLDNSIFDKPNINVTHSAVCFCDLPLSLTFDHINQYGRYSIGLTKSWAIENRVTPVRYIHSKTPDATNNILFLTFDKYVQMKQKGQNIMENLIEEMIKEKVITKEEYEKEHRVPNWCSHLLQTFSNIYADMQNHVLRQSAFYRIYQGDWANRVDGKVTTRIFYDEREWRAIKNTNPYLNFGFDDISKIIVTDDSEIDIILEALCNKYKLSSNDQRKALRKIFTHQDIYQDI